MSAFNSEGETMTERVYKYNLALKDVATVAMPAGAQVCQYSLRTTDYACGLE